MEPFFLFCSLPFIFCVLLPWWMVRRARRFLGNWAKRNGYEVVSTSARWLRKGPYFLLASGNQIVLRITVVDSSDDVRTGFACCGSLWKGVFIDEVDVTWDPSDSA